MNFVALLQIADLNEAKDLTETSLQEKEVPLDVCIENLTIREGRQDIDLVQDEVENQLHKVSIAFVSKMIQTAV